MAIDPTAWAMELQAFIGWDEVFGAFPDQAVLVFLPQGITMLPLTTEWLSSWKLPHLPILLGDGALPPELNAIGVMLSQGGLTERRSDGVVEHAGGRVAYVEVLHLAGRKRQAGLVWEGGVVDYPLRLSGRWAMEEILARLGVRPHCKRDAFATEGLGRFSTTKSWAKFAASEPLLSQKRKKSSKK
ncbi:MAG: hypothetical protein PHE53_13370 [Thermoguttaceae bacterium]|nr:hypothetical protein [Thermoguttaceae bacterium]